MSDNGRILDARAVLSWRIHGAVVVTTFDGMGMRDDWSVVVEGGVVEGGVGAVAKRDRGLRHNRRRRINRVGEDGAGRFDGEVVMAAMSGELIEHRVHGRVDGGSNVDDGRAVNAGKRRVLCAGVFLAWRIDSAVVETS